MSAAKDTPEQPPVKITPWGWFRENVEAVIIAVVLALIIRHFAVQAFEIPTGSMAPTLYGDNRPQKCPECKWKFSLGASRDSNGHRSKLDPGKKITCPNCHNRFYPQEILSTGHKILVNKFVYAFSEPKRWDVIVFKYPRDPWRDYIKRLGGLPGETIAIRNGDIYINGKILRKTDKAQESLWFPVYSMEYVPECQSLIPWKGSHDEGWTIRADRLLVDTANRSVARFERPDSTDDIEFRTGYNFSSAGDEDSVPDARIAFNIKPNKPGGTFTVKIEENQRDSTLEHCFVLKIEGEGGKATGLYRHEKPFATNNELTLPVGKSTEIVCVHRDDRMQLWINGEKLLEHDYGDGSVPGGDEEVDDVDLELIAEDMAAEISGVTIHRDLYHADEYGPEKIPEGYYFALGDNTVNSTDSRGWGPLPKKNIVGRAFMVFWKPWEIKLIK